MFVGDGFWWMDEMIRGEKVDGMGDKGGGGNGNDGGFGRFWLSRGAGAVVIGGSLWLSMKETWNELKMQFDVGCQCHRQVAVSFACSTLKR